MQKTKRPSAPPAEQRIVLHGISWETYESLLSDHEDKSAPRFTYDRGTLEIMSPSPAHERTNRRLSQLVLEICAARDLEAEDFGSTTYKREDIERGFEPDSCFYIENEPLVRDKDRLDLEVDPPPDLVVEIDVTSFSLDKLPLYAGIRVPEVWRYEDAKLEILRLDSGSYRKSAESKCLAGIRADALTDLMQKRKSLRRTEWLKKIREAARKNPR